MRLSSREIRIVAIALLLYLGPMAGNVAHGQHLVINEILSSNATTIYDADGDTPDWIEIYNPAATPVNLNGYGLSDDEAVPLKWTFPAITLQPSQHLLVLASDKGRRSLPPNWVTVVDQGDEWEYLVPGSEPSSDWKTVGFSSNGWSRGPSGFGYGDGDDATVIASTMSLFMRKTFVIADAGNISEAFLHMDYDDAFVAYLNGVEIARANLGQPGDPTPYNRLADIGHEANMYRGGAPERFDIASLSSILRQGDNVLAVQVHNVGTGSSDLTAIAFLTFGMINQPADPGGVPDILNPGRRYLHTNFKLKSEGETILLSDADGQILDLKGAGEMLTDVSYGRQPDGGNQWYYFREPTPGSANTTTAFGSTLSGVPQFSHEGGFYDSGISLELSGSTGDTIYYSLDGSIPTAESEVFSLPRPIDATTVVRARIIHDDALPGRTSTNTYLMGRSFSLPVLSIATTPANLWDRETGIYVMGDSASAEYPHFGANFWEDWEKPAHIEFYEPDGALGFELDAGIKIFGGWSRGQDQKSFSIFARGQYGTGEIDYRLFHDKDISEFEAFVLRNSGNDGPRSMFRDGLVSSLLRDLDIERQAFRPSIVYVNGGYWGILNIREKVNEHFVASNKRVDPDNIDLLEGYGNAIHGDAVHYNAMRNFISNNDLSEDANYQYVKTQIDVANFMLYTVTMIYVDNRDWPGNNIKFWRPRTPTGKWRWIVFDTDFAFGLWDQYSFLQNTLEFALEPDGPGWPNPPWSTLLLRRLMMNSGFKRDFVNCFADRLNTTFEAQRVLDMIAHYEDMLADEMSLHLDRWNRSMTEWNDHLSIMRTFAGNRTRHVIEHIKDRFGLPDTHLVTLNVSDSHAGSIRINTMEIDSYPWSGTYFEGNPIQVSAVPHQGHRFTGWTGMDSGLQILTLDLTGDVDLVAQFEQDADYVSPIVINEISYDPPGDSDAEDWVELYNNSEITMDISGWVLRDSDDAHAFALPAHSQIEGRSYVILTRDGSAFSAIYPETDNAIGDFDFGLAASGDSVRLYDDTGYLIDSVMYTNSAPWPEISNGTGTTLELLNPDLDNALPESWIAESLLGTPGSANVAFLKEEGKRALQDAIWVLQVSTGSDRPPVHPNYTVSGFDIDGDDKAGMAEALYFLQKAAGVR